MSVQATSWALEQAPDCPPSVVIVLVGLANHADDKGRGAYPSQEKLAWYARKSDRQVRSDLAQLAELGLIVEGDQRLTAHIPADERPVVYDLAMDRHRPAYRKGQSTTVRAPRDRKPTSPPIDEGTGSPLPGGSPLPAGSPVQRDRKPTSEGTGSPLPTNRPLNRTEPSLPSGEHARAKRATRIPDDFTVTPAMVAWLTEKFPHIDGQYETEKFIDYWQSAAGPGAVKHKWDLAWKNWMRRAAEMNPAYRQNGHSRASPANGRQQETDALFDRAAQRIAAREAR